jgi:hypothetical protein
LSGSGDQSNGAGDGGGVVGQACQQNAEGGQHADPDDGHLPFLGEVHRHAAAGDGVDDGDDPDADDDEVESPAQHGGEDDGRGVDGDAALEAALEQEDAGAEQAGFLVEAFPEVFVGGVDTELAVDRQEDGAHENEREWQTEIILDEGDSVFEGLARQREIGDGARLRGRDRQADGKPARGGAALEIGVEVIGVARAPRPVGGDADDRSEQHEPVEGGHAKAWEKIVRAATTTAKTPSTNRYTPRQVRKPGTPGDSSWSCSGMRSVAGSLPRGGGFIDHGFHGSNRIHPDESVRSVAQ